MREKTKLVTGCSDSKHSYKGKNSPARVFLHALGISATHR